MARIRPVGAGAAHSARLAEPADLPRLKDLLGQWQTESGRPERVRKSLGTTVDPKRLGDVLASATSDVLVGLVDGQVTGMALVWLTSSGPLAAAPSAAMGYLVVAPSARRRGLGRVLVMAAAAWAEERGVEQLVAHVYPNLREANRFYARLGFAPLTVRRVAPVAALRRQFATPVSLRLLEPARPRRLLAARRAATSRSDTSGSRRSVALGNHHPT